MSLKLYATNGEARTARKLVQLALAQGWSISVSDGEETTVTRSTRELAILDAMCTTDEDILTLHLPISGKRAGSFVLIYGNAEDGSELIADHTDNENCERLYREVYGEPVA